MFCRIKFFKEIQWIEFKAKTHSMGTSQINKIYLACFDEKMYIIHNGLDALALGN